MGSISRKVVILVCLALVMGIFSPHALAQSINVNGTWKGTWHEEYRSEEGCTITQGGSIWLTLAANNGDITGAGQIDGYACYSKSTCVIGDYIKLSVAVQGHVSGNQITLKMVGTAPDGPCRNIILTPSYSGILTTTSITIGIQAGDASAKYELTKTSSGISKNTGSPESPGSVCCGDPIDLGTGNMFHHETDYETSGYGSLAFYRYYNSFGSHDSVTGTLGKNWRSNFDRYLRLVFTGGSPGIVQAERPEGRELTFILQNGRWICDSDVDYELSSSGQFWVLQDHNDNLEVYQTSGSTAYLVRIVQRGGYQQDIQYEGTRPVAVQDSFGRMLRFAYQGNLLKTVSAPGGFTLTYDYNASGQSGSTPDRLVSVTYNTSPVTRKIYAYGNPAYPFAVTSVTDENGGIFSRWSYDSQGRAISSELAGGVNRLSIAFNDQDGSRTVTGALGLVERYNFGGLQGVPKVSGVTRVSPAIPAVSNPTYIYDDNGYPAIAKDWNGNTSLFDNDVRGLPNIIIEAFGLPEGRTNVVEYLSDYHLPFRQTEIRKITEFGYDTKGNLLQRKETDTTTHTVPYSTRGKAKIWRSTYNGVGQVLTATEPRADVTATTSFSYYDNGDLKSIQNALGQITSFTAYNERGQPLTMVDGNNVTTRFSYHPRGWLTKREVVAAAGNSITELSYDAAGQTISIKFPDGSARRFGYDTAHRLQAITNSLGESISYIRDAAGNVTREEARDAQGRITKSTTRTFDVLGRLTQETGAAGQATAYGYDGNGNATSIRDGLNRTATQAFDALNRRVSSSDPLGNRVREAFDTQDNLVSVTDPRSLTTSFVYDGFGRVIQESSPDRGITGYEFDGSDNRTKELDARGIFTLRTFDKLNRVTAENFPDSSSENIAYSYDSTASGNKGIGRLTGFSDETGSTSLQYDERGNVIRVTCTIAGKVYATGYAYDLADRLVSITYPSGHILTYGRDAEGQITAVNLRLSASASPIPLATSITHLPFGPVSGLTYGNGLTCMHGYDLDYRLTSITTGSGGNIVQRLALAFDAVNNITAITDLLDGKRSQQFGYDANSRLTNAVGVYGNLRYSYDGVGNRLSETHNGVTSRYSYPANANRLEKVDSGGINRTFTYTPAGNVATDNRGAEGNYSYAYGARNRLKTVTRNGSAVASYAYNAFGERLIKTVGQTVTHFQFDQQSRLIAESNGQTGATQREYVWLGAMPLAVIEPTGTVYFIHSDHLNTPQKMTDAARTIVWDRQQKPFGETVSITTGGGTGPRVEAKGFNAQGQFQIAVTGPAGASCIIQRANDLSGNSWTAIATNTLPFSFTDSAAPGTRTRFYRATATASTASPVVVTLNLRFPGQYYDEELNLDYNLHRNYSPTLGRYYQSDPFGIIAGIDAYSYAKGNSIINTDPTGLNVRVYAMGIHEAIAIDTSDGVITFGFGPVGLGPEWSDGLLPLAYGRIDEGNQPYSKISGGTLVSERPLSIERGNKLVQELRRFKDNPPIYLLTGFNCNTFANMVASRASSGSFTPSSYLPFDINRFRHSNK